MNCGFYFNNINVNRKDNDLFRFVVSGLLLRIKLTFFKFLILLECVCAHTYMCERENYATIKKDTMPPAATWMDFECIMLNEISHTEKDKYCMITLKCGI